MSTQNHGTLRIFSTGVADSEEEYRGLAPLHFFFERQRFHIHTCNTKEQNCMEYKLDDLPIGRMRGHRQLDDTATSIA